MYSPHTRASSPLNGWRARAWAWVLFVALLKGLVPHAALASVAMPGDPALVWCAPGTPAALASEGKAAPAQAATAHACVCAASADGLPLPAGTSPVFAVAAVVAPVAGTALAHSPQPALPPPARGPPTS